MAAEAVQNPPSLSKRLRKQWKWVAVAVAIVALAIMSRSAEAHLNDLTSNSQPSSAACRVEVKADVLNVRAGPGADTPSVDKLSRGAIVDAQPVTLNGFRKLGDNRWVSQDFVIARGACG